jgi:hypothetical protein
MLHRKNGFVRRAVHKGISSSQPILFVAFIEHSPPYSPPIASLVIHGTFAGRHLSTRLLDRRNLLKRRGLYLVFGFVRRCGVWSRNSFFKRILSSYFAIHPSRMRVSKRRHGSFHGTIRWSMDDIYENESTAPRGCRTMSGWIIKERCGSLFPIGNYTILFPFCQIPFSHRSVPRGIRNGK